jgi:hypothetical protein
MSGVDVNADVSGVEALAARATAAKYEVMQIFQREGSILAVEIMRSNIPIKTGQLRESVRSFLMPDGFYVRAEMPYAPFVDRGTRPHIIRPKGPEVWPALSQKYVQPYVLAVRRPKALRWFDAFGGIHFARIVHHPGTKGVHFIQKTADFLQVELPQMVRDILTRVFG